jgi:transposase
MAAAIGVRTDYTSSDLRGFARRCSDPDQVRRLLALASIVDGGSRSDAAKFAGVTLQIVRDWVLRFNEGGPDALATRKAPGRASILNDEQRARLAEQVEAGPIPAAHGVVRWRLADLAQWVWDEFALSVTRHTLGRELRAMGYRKLSARPRHHGQKPDDIVDFKKTSPPVWRRSNEGSREERP